MTQDCTCENCGKCFKSQKDSVSCFSCALARLAVNGCPEEGDFNSALIISGEMTDDEARWLREDLESVDHPQEDDDWDWSYERRGIEDDPLYFYVPRREDE
jgi:hypothetical protein